MIQAINNEFIPFKYSINAGGGDLCGIVANMLDCNIVVS